MTDCYSEIQTELVKVSTNLEGVNKRLDVSNGRIAKNEERIGSLEKVDAQMLTQIGRVLSDEHDRRLTRKKWNTYWLERALWIAGIVILAVLSKTGILKI